MIDTYSMACTEVLVILKYYLSTSELNKIPVEKLEFFERNKDINYNYEIDENLPLENQKISEMANSIMITLYRDYFANEKQKKILEEILILNDKKKEFYRKKQFELDIFRNKNSNEIEDDYNQNNEVQGLVEIKKEKWYTKIFLFFRNILNK